MSFGVQFTGFEGSAFEAFEPRKWSSNVFNIERFAVREQLKALGATLEASVCARRPFRCEVTPHTPSVFNGKRVSELALFFTRTDAEQKAIAPLLDARIALPDQISDAGEHHRHVTLGARIDHDGLEVGLLLHSRAWLDVMNLLNRCRVPAEAATLLGLLHGLPGAPAVRIGPGRDVPAAGLTPAHLKELEDAVLNETFLIRIGRAYAPGDPELSGAGFPGQCRVLLEALLPVWDFIAWQPASSFILPSKTPARESAPAANDPLPHLPVVTVGARVRLIDGVFAGRDGRVTDLDAKGNARVLVGKVNVRTDAKSLRVL